MSLGPPEDRRSSFTPALAVRVGIAGSLVLALFAIVFFRLWFLQVLTGNRYVLTASDNQTQVVALAPARGEILASDGQPLVTSTRALAVQIDPTGLPVHVNQSNVTESFGADDRIYDRLARVLGWKTTRHRCAIPTPPPSCDVAGGHCASTTFRQLSRVGCLVATSIAKDYYADATIKQPVNTRVQYYIAERGNLFRGVDVTQVSVPGYPFGGLAAQALGTVGRLTPAEHRERSFKGVNRNAIVGQSGLEASYDQYLRGRFGKQRVHVNATGIFVGQGHTTRPVAGERLRTTLDVKAQQVGDAALAKSIGENNGQGGAFIMMNADTGAVNAMGSEPTYNPAVFTHQLTEAAYEREFGSASNAPLFNRATQAEALDGSTFKVITSTAGLESGTWTPEETYDDTGQFCPDGPSVPTACIHNAEHTVGGVIDMASALKISDDVFYYHLGDLLNVDRPQGGPLQRWGRAFGIGRNPHIDIPDASEGLMPSPAYIDGLVHDEKECEAARGQYRYTDGAGGYSSRPLRGYHRTRRTSFDEVTGTGGCGFADPDSSWTVGDNINAAVGQGDDAVSPLQLALVYAAVENGGTIVRPHLGDDVENADGTVLQRFSFPAQRHLDIAPEYLDTIRTGLREAAQGGGPDPSPGTSQTVMQNFGLPIYGKTGTASYVPTSGPEKGVETDSAWYATYSTGGNGKPPEVCIVWVEGGGYGAIASAPVARELLHQFYFGTPGPYVAGDSHDQ